MNERIKQLAHEAGLPTYNPEGIPTKLEKFAELIVRECIDTARNAKSLEAAVMIKQHFGVSE
jgi:hypothetical protein